MTILLTIAGVFAIQAMIGAGVALAIRSAAQRALRGRESASKKA